MNQADWHICFQCWQFMILVNNLWLWRSPMSASHLNFWKLLFQHLHLMTSACKTLQNMQAWNHHKSLLQQLGTSTDRLHKSIQKNSDSIMMIPMYLHYKPVPSTCLKKKTGRLWENLMFTALTSINSMNWQVAPPVAEPVLLQPSAFLFPLFALLHLVQFAAPAQPSRHGKRIAKRLCSARDSHPGPTACNSATWSLSCWTWSNHRTNQMSPNWSGHGWDMTSLGKKTSTKIFQFILIWYGISCIWETPSLFSWTR